MRPSRDDPPSSPDPAPAPDVFVDEHGETLRLDPGHRARVRLPSAVGYGRASAAEPGTSDDAALAYLREVGDRVRLAVRVLELAGGGIAGRDVLVIGASDGAEVAWCRALGAASVVGTDHGDAFVGDEADRRVARRERLLDLARRRAADAGMPAAGDGRVRFAIDDVTAPTLPASCFDAAFGWQTLEHVPDVAAALRGLHRLLRPGGVCVQEYNPFFSIDGGHTPATLDLAWGHARLGDADVERYLRERRPDEADAAIAFFRTALHRATQAEVRGAVVAAGFERVVWLPRTRTEDLLQLDAGILRQVRRIHPRVEVIDLVSRIVRFAAVRPEAG